MDDVSNQYIPYYFTISCSNYSVECRAINSRKRRVNPGWKAVPAAAAMVALIRGKSIPAVLCRAS
jgi:hypothetical protein